MIIQNFVRDQLANERTYLAWLITGITMMGVGTALVKFNAIITGIMFNTLGIIFIVLSFFRYKQVSDTLINEKFIINTFMYNYYYNNFCFINLNFFYFIAI